ncbi:glycosyltransferase [Oceanicoccus sp. KOV_DT_Chl]|uniref:glycosyltransferase n=1 Tax=Oceanicoccus sp. KOV_DT_Chl TaxID=1904639 RepID=UPI00190EB0F3|nr:glycosyltransferase [Oceanicoccus sp. KOV_DT_Chl]
MMRTLSIIICVYFNEKSLPELYEQLRVVEGELLKKDVNLELIFVNDGSGDGSLEKLLEIKEKRPTTKVISLTRNFGVVQAAKIGEEHVTGDAYVRLPADLQEPPHLILEIVDKWLAGSKFVISTRVTRDDPLSTKIFAWIYYRLLRLFVVPSYPSGGFDLALMDKEFLPYMKASGKNINPNLFAYWLGYEPTSVEYHRQERIHGSSKWTFSKRLTFFIDSLLGFSIFPIRLISMIGILVSLISFGYGGVIVVQALLGNIDVPGFSALAALLSFLLGIIIIMLGIIGEYVWRIFDEIQDHPVAVVEKIY